MEEVNTEKLVVHVYFELEDQGQNQPSVLRQSLLLIREMQDLYMHAIPFFSSVAVDLTHHPVQKDWGPKLTSQV